MESKDFWASKNNYFSHRKLHIRFFSLEEFSINTTKRKLTQTSFTEPLTKSKDNSR